MDQKEAEIRLGSIAEIIDQAFVNKRPMLLSTAQILEQLYSIATSTEEQIEGMDRTIKPTDHIIISCDASVKVNPGGPSSVGVVIQFPDKRDDALEVARIVPATSSNQAEYDAVYFGLTTLMAIRNNPGCTIEVRSDSQIVVKQLNGEMKCNDEKLKMRRDIIRELVGNLPVEVRFNWRPRNSTPELKLANFLAQDLISVPRH